MSTIVSPRPSISLSSRRNSNSSTTTITSNTTNTTNKAAPGGSGTAAERGALRRNRAALRDYYNLKPVSDSSPAASTPDVTTPVLDPTQESELDKPGFNTETYVSNLLASEGLEKVLRVEAGLVSDIRTLDGEKKALVYDNYSKLIAATDTIRHMREKMDPLTPTTSTLSPAIGHIAEIASALTQDLRKSSEGQSGARKDRQRALVKWVLAAPERMESLGRNEAEEEWKKVEAVLAKWNDVEGVENIRKRCQTALKGKEG